MGDDDKKRCSSCGAGLEPGLRFCTNCGAPVQNIPPQAEPSSPLAPELLALGNDFLRVKELDPENFSFSSQTHSGSPAQKLSIAYEAIVHLEHASQQLIFWEKMMESLAGMDSGISHEVFTQRGASLTRSKHGQLLLGGKYGFEYGRLHTVIKTIAQDHGWKFKQVIRKPGATPSAPAPEVPAQDAPPQRCPACGAGLMQGTLFCTQCGAQIADRHEPHRPPVRKHRIRPALLRGGIGVMTGMAILVVIFSQLPERENKAQPKTQVATVKQPAAHKLAPPKEHTASMPAPQPAVNYNEEGMQKAKAGHIQEAIVLFEKAVQAGPENFSAWNNLGLALRKTGKYTDAVQAYERAIKINPYFAVAYKNLGIALEQQAKMKEAARAYQAYARLNPSAPDAGAAKQKAAMLMDTKKN